MVWPAWGLPQDYPEWIATMSKVHRVMFFLFQNQLNENRLAENIRMREKAHNANSNASTAACWEAGSGQARSGQIFLVSHK